MSLRLTRFRALLKQFSYREEGAVLMLFGLTVPVLLGLTFALIDYNRASTTRLALQAALDSAALYIARSDATNPTEIQRIGTAMLNANMAHAKYGAVTTAAFTMDANQRVTATAEASVPMSVTALLGRDSIPVSAQAEVLRSSNSVEVALALDVTGSMAGQALTDLKIAAKDLVDLVVKDVQTPHYTKVSLVPYSMAVNVGTYANQVRGTPTKNCTNFGCEKYRFRSAQNDWYGNAQYNTFNISTCVTERTGINAYTDVGPNTSVSNTLVGKNYPGPDNGCLSSMIMPLSSNRTTLKAAIDTYNAQGSTAGHIGLAWGWYMVSPNFASLWPSASRPAAYGTRDLIKVVVLMTDGAFNTPYYNGVIAKDAGSGSGNELYHINQNATNGNAFSQADKLCAAMKAAGVIVYTVGLGVGSDPAANGVLTNCATSTKHVYFPSGGTDLKDAFRAIGQEINSLRISH